MPVCVIVSFRLGLSDGVSIIAAGWQRALEDLGFDVRTVAGDGPVDHLLPGLAIGASEPPADDELRMAFDGADLVVVENLCTIPLNLPAARAVGRVLTGRPAVLHHHDPPWQLPQHTHVTELPLDDPAWRHVVINDTTLDEFAARGIDATRIYNGFDTDPPRGDSDGVRGALDIHENERLLVHPVRAIPRKNVPAAVRLAEALDATYWLVGPAEDGYDATLADVLAGARCRVIHQRSPGTVHDAYAAADAIAFPSIREGFGNPPIEAALHRRPAVVGHYTIADELRAYGFEWFEPDDPESLDAFLRAPDDTLLEHNRKLAVDHFSHERMAGDIARLLDDAGRVAVNEDPNDGRRDDPVLAKRARIAKLTDLGQKIGYALFGVAIVVFVIGFVIGYSGTLVTIIVASLLVGSAVLAPSIVFSYAVRAAEREDRELGR